MRRDEKEKRVMRKPPRFLRNLALLGGRVPPLWERRGGGLEYIKVLKSKRLQKASYKKTIDRIQRNKLVYSRSLKELLVLSLPMTRVKNQGESGTRQKDPDLTGFFCIWI